MFIWTIMWFWLKLEYIIEWDFRKVTSWFIIPTIIFTRSQEDEIGYRYYILNFNWMIFSISIQYHYPDNYFFDEEGEFLGNRIFPLVKIETVEYHFQ